MCLELCKEKNVQLKDGKEVIIRLPREGDEKQAKEYVNSLIDEDALILINERRSLEDEKKWLKENLEAIKKNKRHVFVAEFEGEIISIASLKKGKWRQSHVASVHMGVKKGYRRLGIGTIMMKTLLEIGKKDKEIKVIYLDVYTANEPAITMYKKLGFKEVARLKNRVQYKGKLGDMMIMDFKGELEE